MESTGRVSLQIFSHYKFETNLLWGILLARIMSNGKPVAAAAGQELLGKSSCAKGLYAMPLLKKQHQNYMEVKLWPFMRKI